MLQITIEPMKLTQEQREHVAGFLLTFGTSNVFVGGCTQDAEGDDPEMNAAEAFGVSAEVLEMAKTSTVFVDPLGSLLPAVPQIPIAVGDIVSGAASPATIIAQLLPSIPPPPPPPPATLEVSNVGPSLVIGSPTVDKSGAIWDAATHSSSKAITADGMWRKKRGASEAATIPAPPPVDSVLATPPPLPTATGPDLRGQFVSLVGNVTKAIHANKLTQEEVEFTLAKVGLSKLPQLATNLEAVPQVTADIDAIIASRA